MKAGNGHPVLARAIAAAAALAVVAQGGGVPMCVSLLARAAAPCAMHAPGTTHAHRHQLATLSPAPSEHGTCHGDAASLGCATGGTCPTGGTARPVSVTPPVARRASIRVTSLGLAATFLSYLAPPLSPPPQA